MSGGAKLAVAAPIKNPAVTGWVKSPNRRGQMIKFLRGASIGGSDAGS